MSERHSSVAPEPGAVPTTAPSRLLYLDNYRILLTILVILHHAALAYGGSGAWGFTEGATDSASPYLLSFFMSAFFFLAGYFTPRSLDRKGTGRFVLDRLIRLGVPLIVYTLLVRNLNRCILHVLVGNVPSRWVLGYDPDHLWFVQTLLVFSLLTVFVRILTGKHATRSHVLFEDRFPRNRTLLAATGVLAGLTFAVRIAMPVGRWFLRVQPAHFVHYVFSFTVGTLACRGKWLTHLSWRTGRRWGWVALGMAPAFAVLFISGGALESDANIALFMGGLRWQALGYALWESVMVIAMNVFLISLFGQRLNRSGTIAGPMAKGVYTVYIIHVTILLAIQGLLYGVAIPSILKFVVAGAGGHVCRLSPCRGHPQNTRHTTSPGIGMAAWIIASTLLLTRRAA
jgi:glucan biosynthesis protein C